jgi:hypothetical protein
MRLQSARDLKAELTSSLLDLEPLTPTAIGAYGIRAARVDVVERRLSTFALGVAPRKPGDYRLAVRVQRRGIESSPHIALIKDLARGEVDVRYVGRVVKSATPWHRRLQRPLLAGSSVGHYEITAGTLGCFVRLKNGATAILSNNHVLADENRAARGDAIIQPGRYDGGRRKRDAVASLQRFVRLKAKGANALDCAVATLLDGVNCEPAVLKGSGRLQGVTDDVAEDAVLEKIGRTTGRTRGRIASFELDGLMVEYDAGNIRFDGVIEIEGASGRAFSAGGDSGSVIYSREGKLAYALLFANSQQGGSNGRGLTYAHPLSTALERLAVELVL